MQDDHRPQTIIVDDDPQEPPRGRSSRQHRERRSDRDGGGINWGALLGFLGVLGTILGIIGFFIDDLPAIVGGDDTLSPEDFFGTVSALEGGAGDDLGGIALTQQAIESGAGFNQATQDALAAEQAALQATLDTLRTQQAVSGPSGGEPDGDSSSGDGDDTGSDAGTDPTPSGLTLTDEDQNAITDAVLRYDEAVRYLLETGDTSQIDQVAAGEALQDRLDAADILKRAGDCVWEYDHRGLYIDTFTVLSERAIEVLALVDRNGTVFCPAQGYLPEYAFEGPYYNEYDVIFLDDRWIVTNSGLADEDS